MAVHLLIAAALPGGSAFNVNSGSNLWQQHLLVAATLIGGSGTYWWVTGALNVWSGTYWWQAAALTDGRST